MTGALVLPDTSFGMIDASTTRNASTPLTRNSHPQRPYRR
jgi:hypothetical protein